MEEVLGPLEFTLFTAEQDGSLALVVEALKYTSARLPMRSPVNVIVMHI